MDFFLFNKMRRNSLSYFWKDFQKTPLCYPRLLFLYMYVHLYRACQEMTSTWRRHIFYIHSLIFGHKSQHREDQKSTKETCSTVK